MAGDGTVDDANALSVDQHDVRMGFVQCAGQARVPDHAAAALVVRDLPLITCLAAGHGTLTHGRTFYTLEDFQQMKSAGLRCERKCLNGDG